ncbi:MAG: nucleoside-diphosphate sugar epimerase/dehydratase [Anaerolinea sp.]
MSSEKRFHNRLERYFYSLSRISIDVLIGVFAYLIVYMVNTERVFADPALNAWFIALAAAAMVGSLYIFGVYRRIWERTSGHGITLLINAAVAPTLLLALLALIANPRPLSIATVLFGNLIAFVGFVGIRYRSRLVSGLVWRWRVWLRRAEDTRERVLIVGAGEAGQSIALSLKHGSANRRFKVVGFVDDDPEKQGMFVEGSPVLGTCQSIQSITPRKEIDLIVVAIHNISGLAFREILTQCERTTARIKVVPDVISQFQATHHVGLLRDVKPEDLLGRSVISKHHNVDLTLIADKIILITGAAGSIGSELSRQILDYAPTQVILMDNNESGLHDLYIDILALKKPINVQVVLGDITAEDQVQRIFERYHPQIVFHAAAYKHVPLLESHPAEAIRVNLHGTRVVAEQALKHHIERFVFISTDKAVNPSSIMGASKRLCELLLHNLMCQRDCRTLFTSVRFGNVLGSRGSVVPTFTQQIERGGPVTVTHPEMTRYFMTIPEAVNLIIHAAALTRGDDIFILQMGEVVRIVELAERLIRLRGLRPYTDIAIEFMGVRSGEKMHEELYSERECPEPTPHPSIIKIRTWDNTLNCEQFMQRLDALIAQRCQTTSDILSAMRAMMHSVPLALTTVNGEAHPTQEATSEAQHL